MNKGKRRSLRLRGLLLTSEEIISRLPNRDRFFLSELTNYLPYSKSYIYRCADEEKLRVHPNGERGTLVMRDDLLEFLRR